MAAGGQSRGTGRIGLLPVVVIALSGILTLRIAHIAAGDDSGPVTIATAAAQEKGPDSASGSPMAPDAGQQSETAATSAGNSNGGSGTAGLQPATAGDGEPGGEATPAAGTAAGDPGNIADRPTVAAAKSMPDEIPRFMTRSEIEVLQRLAERRRELEQRARDLEMREALLMAAEQRLGDKLEELKQIEARIEATFNRKENEKNEQFQGLVGMYENMKPKEAARIFDTLDMDILLSVVEQMSARKMAPILADMSPEAAQRLTVELAARASGEITAKVQSLPVIADRDPG